MSNIRPISYKPIEFIKYFSPDGEEFNFDSHYRFLMSEDGFGMPGINYLSQTGPYQHGETLYDYRIQARIIQLIFRQSHCDRESYWNGRSQLVDMLRPNRQLQDSFGLGTLRKILPNFAKRDIDVLIQAGPLFSPSGSNVWDEFGITETVRFIAPDPSFYDPTPYSLQGEVSIPSAQLVLPFTFDASTIVFVEESTFLGGTITYPGTWLSYPSMTLTGPIENPAIRNLTTGEEIGLNYTVIAGELITINLDYGNKRVTSSINGNLTGYLTATSDLATFHIAPAPEAPGGVNNIAVSGLGMVGDQTDFDLTYYIRYIAI